MEIEYKSKGNKKFKSWSKIVSHIDTAKNKGFQIEGRFINDSNIYLNEKDIIINVAKEEDNSIVNTYIYQVNDGKLRLIKRTDYNKDFDSIIKTLQRLVKERNKYKEEELKNYIEFQEKYKFYY